MVARWGGESENCLRRAGIDDGDGEELGGAGLERGWRVRR